MSEKTSEPQVIRLEEYFNTQDILLEVSDGETITTDHYLESKDIGQESIQELNEVKSMQPHFFFFNVLAIQLAITCVWLLILISAILPATTHASRIIFFSLLLSLLAINLLSYPIARLLINNDHDQ